MVEPDEVDVEHIQLAEGECWVYDPEFLALDSGVKDVLAVQFTGGALWYLDGATRKWISAEKPAEPDKGKIMSINR